MTTAPRWTREQIFEGVREDVAECLALDVDETLLESNFALDLGGESIDLLDLAFRNERRFNIRSSISRISGQEQLTFDESGNLAETTLRRLQVEFPGIDWQKHLNGRKFHRWVELFTIELIVELIYQTQFQKAVEVAAAAEPAVRTVE